MLPPHLIKKFNINIEECCPVLFCLQRFYNGWWMLHMCCVRLKIVILSLLMFLNLPKILRNCKIFIYSVNINIAIGLGSEAFYWCSTTAKLFNLPLEVILKNNISLSYFIDFMNAIGQFLLMFSYYILNRSASELQVNSYRYLLNCWLCSNTTNKIRLFIAFRRPVPCFLLPEHWGLEGEFSLFCGPRTVPPLSVYNILTSWRILFNYYTGSESGRPDVFWR